MQSKQNKIQQNYVYFLRATLYVTFPIGVSALGPHQGPAALAWAILGVHISRGVCKKKMDLQGIDEVASLKPSRHDANFVINGGTAGCLMTTCSATNDDKVGIMTTLGFPWSLLL